MKKVLRAAVAALLGCTLLGSSVCFASAETDIPDTYANVLPDREYYAIPEWDILILQPEDAVCVDEGDGFYIYAEEEGYIPCVMVTVYDAYDSEEEFFADYTDYLSGAYEDLEIAEEIPELDLAGDTYYEVDYTYALEDTQVVNRCIAKEFNGLTYLFTSKEVPDLDLTVGSILEDVVEGSYFLANSQPVLHGAIELNWDAIAEYVDTEGSFAELPEANLTMFVPEEFEEYELTQEDVDDFFIYIAGYGDWIVYAQKIPMAGDFTIYDYMDMLNVADDVDYIDLYVINGLLFLKYEVPDSDMICFSTLCEDGSIAEFSYAPISDDVMWDRIAIMVTSLQQMEE